MAIHFQLRDGLVELTFQGKIIAADFQQVLEKLQELEARMEVTPDRITDMSEGGSVGVGLQGGDRYCREAPAGKTQEQYQIRHPRAGAGTVWPGAHVSDVQSKSRDHDQDIQGFRERVSLAWPPGQSRSRKSGLIRSHRFTSRFPIPALCREQFGTAGAARVS